MFWVPLHLRLSGENVDRDLALSLPRTVCLLVSGEHRVVARMSRALWKSGLAMVLVDGHSRLVSRLEKAGGGADWGSH